MFDALADGFTSLFFAKSIVGVMVVYVARIGPDTFSAAVQDMPLE